MTTLVCVNPTPIPETGSVVLAITTSGDLVSSVMISRRLAGGTETMAVNPPADQSDGAGGVLLVGGMATIVDSCAPLGVTFEYLASVGRAAAVLSSTPTILETGTDWWLGCPARPYLNIRMPKTLVSPACSTAGRVVLTGLSDQSISGRSTLIEVDGQASAVHGSKPTSMPSYTVTVATRTLSDLQLVRDILAPGDVLCLRAPGTSAYGFLIVYLSVRSATVSRVSSDLRKEWRRVSLETVEVLEPIGGTYGSVGARFDDLCDVYSTLALMEAANVSWADVPYGVPGGLFPAVYRTCAELTAGYASCATLTATGHTSFEVLRGDV